jgi:hypothetical protein
MLGNPQEMEKAIDTALDLIHEWHRFRRQERDIDWLLNETDATMSQLEDALESYTEE